MRPWHLLVVLAAGLLAGIMAFAVAKGVLDVHAREKCAARGGQWRCGTAIAWHAAVTACDCAELP